MNRIRIKGNKLLTKALIEGRLGLIHPTRGLIPVMPARYPFSKKRNTQSRVL